MLEIRQISHLTSVEYKDLFLANPRKDNRIVPGFIITYGPSNKILFLTTMDKHFDEFVRKVRDVYLEEKDHVIGEGIRGKEYIAIDPLTKHILLNGSIEESSELYKKYVDELSYDDSLLMEEDRVKALFPIIEYHLKETLSLFEKKVSDIKLSSGTGGVYHLRCIIGRRPVIAPMYIECNDDEFKVIIGNLLENAMPIEMYGLISQDGISITTGISELEYIESTSYKVSNNKPVQERSIRLGDRLIHFNTNELPTSNKEEAKKLYSIDSDPKDIIWYELPWNGYIGLYEDKWYIKPDGERTEEEHPERMVNNKFVYISKTDETLFLKEIANKRYHRKPDERTVGGNIHIDCMNKRKIGIITDDGVLIETYFSEDGVTGKYKEALSGKYFYQVYDKDLTSVTSHFIDEKDDVYEAADLFDIKQYIKKEKC